MINSCRNRQLPNGLRSLASAEALLLLIPFTYFLLSEETPIKVFIKGSNARRD
jgi:hypothetical protein